MKISTQLNLAAAGVAIIGISSVAALFFGAATEDAHVINYTGTLSADVQRLVKDELADQPNDELIAEADRIIEGLINGDNDLDLPRATDPEFLSRMQEVETAWN